MKLFQTGKVGIYITKLEHNQERRPDGEVQVLVLSCRVNPFDHKLAQSMDPIVRTSLFKLAGNADPLAHVQGLAFTLPVERQDIDIYATSDTPKPSIRFEQVKVSCLKARVEKDSHAFTCTFKLTFGPVDARELEWCHAARTTQKWMTFSESEPDLAYQEVGSSSAEDDEDDDAQPALPEPMFDDPRDPELVGAAAAGSDQKPHRPISHATKKGKRR